MQKYAARLKGLKGLNLRIDTTGYVQAIIIFLAIEKLASTE